MNEAVPEAPVSAVSMAKQGREKLGLDAFDALVRRARTCRRFDESMRVPREFLLERAELAHLAPCGANAQRLRFHVVSGAEDCARVFDELAWAGALKDWPGPDEGERPTGYIAILAERAVPGKPAAPITEVDTGIAAQTMMLAARSAMPEVAACMFKAFTPSAVDAMGLDNDKYELKLIMAFGGESEAQLRARMVATLSRIMARPQHNCVLAVSHGSACQEFLRCVTGGGEQPDNGAVLHFDYTDGAFSLLEW